MREVEFIDTIAPLVGPENEEMAIEYGPISMTGNGYDSHDNCRRTVPLAEAVCRVWVLEISIPDSMSINFRPRFD